jgi:hypothetical protein
VTHTHTFRAVCVVPLREKKNYQSPYHLKHWVATYRRRLNFLHLYFLSLLLENHVGLAKIKTYPPILFFFSIVIFILLIALYLFFILFLINCFSIYPLLFHPIWLLYQIWSSFFWLYFFILIFSLIFFFNFIPHHFRYFYFQLDLVLIFLIALFFFFGSFL